MGLFDEVKDLFVAVPDDKKGQILYKWPDINLRKHSTAIVNADEQALFVNQGQVIGVMPPGTQVNPVDQWVGTAGSKLAQYESEREEQGRLNKDRQAFEARTMQRFSDLEQRLTSAAQAAQAPKGKQAAAPAAQEE